MHSSNSGSSNECKLNEMKFFVRGGERAKHTSGCSDSLFRFLMRGRQVDYMKQESACACSFAQSLALYYRSREENKQKKPCLASRSNSGGGGGACTTMMWDRKENKRARMNGGLVCGCEDRPRAKQSTTTYPLTHSQSARVRGEQRARANVGKQVVVALCKALSLDDYIKCALSFFFLQLPTKFSFASL